MMVLSEIFTGFVLYLHILETQYLNVKLCLLGYVFSVHVILHKTNFT